MFVGSFGGSETAADFGFDLEHPQVALGLVVGEGEREVLEEAQAVMFVALQSLQEATGFGGFAGLGGRMGL